MKHIKLIACDLDGVLVKDTFSPVLKKMASEFGLEYTRELERNLFSRGRADAINYALTLLNLNQKEGANLLKQYFSLRNEYINTQENNILSGVDIFLNIIAQKNINLVCYGGLDSSQIADEFSPILSYFDTYICTNNFRPGIHEIIKQYYDLEYSEVLFIDDVNTVAETAKELSVPFIGIPSSDEWSFQKQDMEATGVKYILNNVGEITEDLLEIIDAESASNRFWG